MIADYKENGADVHREFILRGTDDRERAVNVLLHTLEGQGLDVQCITVCLDEQGMKSVVDEGAGAGLFFSYVFDL